MPILTNGNKFQEFVEINNLNRNGIKVNDVTMTLLEAYNLILPLSLIVMSLFFFRDIFFFYWETQLNNYVFLYAMTICLYLDATGITVKQPTYTLLRGSMHWYEMLKDPFYEFFNSLLSQRARRGEANEINNFFLKRYE